MSSLKIHEEFSLEKYGKKFTELHQWMDEPVKIYGPSHRRYRHNIKRTPKEAKELFGEDADLACIDHIVLDRIEEKDTEQKIATVITRITITLNNLLKEYSAFTNKSKSRIIREFIEEGLIKYAHIGLLKRWGKNREFVKNWMQNPNKWVCEKCKYIKDVKIYHIDGNIYNTDPENIVFLCEPCLINLQRFTRKYNPKEKFAAWFFLGKF